MTQNNSKLERSSLASEAKEAILNYDYGRESEIDSGSSDLHLALANISDNKSFGVIANRLKSLGSVWAIDGCSKVVLPENLDSASDDFLKYYLYSKYSVRAMCTLRVKQNNLKTFKYWDINWLSTILCLSIILKDEPMIKLLPKLIQLVIDIDVDYEVACDRNFAGFSIALANIYFSEEASLELVSHDSSYGKLLKYGDQESDIETLLNDALDYHYGLAFRTGNYFEEHDKFFPESFFECAFDNVVGQLMSWEIMAFLSVKVTLSELKPEVNHECFINEEQTFGGRLFSDFSLDDELLNELRQHLISNEEISNALS